jgi:hypothetical protein
MLHHNPTVMQKLERTFLGLCMLLTAGCLKSTETSSTHLPNFSDSAKQFISDQISQHIYSRVDPTNLRLSNRRPLLESAFLTNLTFGEALVVPIQYGRKLAIGTAISGHRLLDLDMLTHAVAYRQPNGAMTYNIITALPDTSFLMQKTGPYSGLLLVEDWNGNLIDRFRVDADGTVWRFNKDAIKGRVNDARITTNEVAPNAVLMVCYEISGYNYSAGNPSAGYAWTESAGCSSIYLPEQVIDYGNGGGGAISGVNAGVVGAQGITAPPPSTAPKLIISPGASPIQNIVDYLKCFTSGSSFDHSYTVTVCVDQPEPGTRTPWGVTSGGPNGSTTAGNIVNVGHSFLILSENSQGTMITRNVGFYPAGSVNPLFPSDQGQLNNNETHGYNISLTFTVSGSQFLQISNYLALGNNPGFLYDLNTNNCTTFVLNALGAGGIHIQTSQGSWTGGQGDDPGDLGEDIRKMPLAAGMSRQTVSNYHPNQGSCN